MDLTRRTFLGGLAATPFLMGASATPSSPRLEGLHPVQAFVVKVIYGLELSASQVNPIVFTDMRGWTRRLSEIHYAAYLEAQGRLRWGDPNEFEGVFGRRSEKSILLSRLARFEAQSGPVLCVSPDKYMSRLLRSQFNSGGPVRRVWFSGEQGAAELLDERLYPHTPWKALLLDEPSHFSRTLLSWPRKLSFTTPNKDVGPQSPTSTYLRIPTWEANPLISREALLKMRQDGPQAFDLEFGVGV